MRVIGAPFNSAGVPGGVAAAPRVLRERGLISALSAAGSPSGEPRPPGANPAQVVDAGDVDTGAPARERDPGSRLLNLSALTTTMQALRHAVADTLLAGDVPLVLGGDCPVLLGALRAAQDLNAKVRPAVRGRPRGCLAAGGEHDRGGGGQRARAGPRCSPCGPATGAGCRPAHPGPGRRRRAGTP